MDEQELQSNLNPKMKCARGGRMRWRMNIDTLSECRDVVMKAKSHLELNLERDGRGNKEGFNR